MKPRHTHYANTFRVILIFVLVLPLLLLASTAGAAASHQDIPEPDSPADPLSTDPIIAWYTFLGSWNGDCGYAIAMDDSGNIYVTGHSGDTWGSPINAFAGYPDAFVAKLNSKGILLWHTFLGSTDMDAGSAIAVDGSGNVYVTGWSVGTWGSPINPNAGGGNAFVAKLNSDGVLQWNTFLGSEEWVSGKGIAVDSSGNVYVVGESDAIWGSPLNAHAGLLDTFVARLNSDGVLQWHTFLGSTEWDEGKAIAFDRGGNIYVTGGSWDTWGSPINAHAGGEWSDAFVAKLNSDGILLWNTFLGSTDGDEGKAIALDRGGNIYVTGSSDANWGSPVNAHTGDVPKDPEHIPTDVFVAELNNDGDLQWHTFLGSTEWDVGNAIALDGNRNIFVSGTSLNAWGSPLNAHSGKDDAFVAKLDSGGNLKWHAFWGSTDTDVGNAIAVDRRGNIYLMGYSDTGWGSPINAHAGKNDAFVAKFVDPEMALRWIYWCALLVLVVFVTILLRYTKGSKKTDQ